MQKNILVIGGTRFFGKLLVQRLLASGNNVTLATRGRTPDPFGQRVTRIQVDRHNEAAMRAAFAGSPVYDVVYDQTCYSPLDAAIVSRVLTGKAKRYVMASSIDVYRPLLGSEETAFSEEDLNLGNERIDLNYPWNHPALATQSYALGKRQAEAYFERESSLQAVRVRIGHVLAGPEDFTGRLASYIDLARSHGALRYANAAAASSFINAKGIAEFLAWTGNQTFSGAINAACDGGLSAFELYQRVGAALEVPVNARPAAKRVTTGELSPFDYAHPLMMDTQRAQDFGYRFGHIDDWLDDTIRQHDLTFA